MSIDLFGRVEYIPPVSLDTATIVTFGYTIADTVGNRARATVSIELDAYDDAAVPIFEPETEPTPEPTPTPDLFTIEPTPTPTPDTSAENQAPIAVNDERGPVRVGATVTVTVLDNDRDPDGPADELSIIAVGVGARIEGSVVVFESVKETAQVGYTIADRFGAESSAVITVVVQANQAPVVDSLEIGTAFETSLAIDLAPQATDADGDDIFFVCCDSIRGGAITNVITSANTFTLVFTPDDGFTGQAGFAYTADDQNGHQTSGSVLVAVQSPLNRPPITVSDTARVPQGATVVVDLEPLSQDPDGDVLTRTLVAQPGNGIDVQITESVALVTVDRSVPVGPAGVFAYRVADGALETLGEVAIEIVAGANEAPQVVNTSIDVPAAASATVDLAPLTIETDVGDFVTWTLDSLLADPLTVSLTGALLQITAPASSVGSVVTIPFAATDTRGETAHGNVEVTVISPTAPHPVAVDNNASARRGELVSIDVLANDIDPLGLGLTITTADPSWGTASVTAGVVQFAPGNRVGNATITYGVLDQANRSAVATISVDTVGAPEQPAPPKVVPDSRQVTISWTNPQSNGRPITGYTIESSTGEIRTVDVQNTYTWTELTNGDSYTFSVSATNDIGTSPTSEHSLAAVPNQVPETPAPPSVAFDDRQLTITWIPPDNAGSDITGYELEIGPASAVQSIGTQTSFMWQGLTNGQDYTFRVRARNDAGFSPFSALSAPEHPAAVPDPPAIGVTIRGNLSDTLIVNWFKPVDNGDEIIEYRIESAPLGLQTTVSGADTTSYDWSGLSTGTKFEFKVQARNRAGWGHWSTTSVGVPPCGLPGAPANLVATRGDGEVSLTWDAAPNNGCAVTGYVIASGGAIQNSTTPGHVFAGLVNGTGYAFTVQATNERGTGSPSAPSNSVTPAGRPICSNGASLNTVLNAPRAIGLNWTAAIDNGTPITDYQLDQGTGFSSIGSASTSTTAGSLANGTTYSFAIRAVNDVGISPTCATASATTWALPTPVELTVSFDIDTAKLTVSGIGGLTLDAMPAVPTYTFTLSGGNINPSNMPNSAGLGSPDAKTADFDITEDGTYSVTLQACNEAGCVEKTSCCNDIALAAPPEQMTPADIQLTYENLIPDSGGVLGTRVNATFFEPQDNGSDITEYEWEAKNSRFGSLSDSSPTPATAGTGTFVTIDFFGGYSSYSNSENDGAAVTWEVRAKAVNDEGPADDWSNWVTITPLMPAPYVNANAHGGFCNGAQTCHTVDIDAYGFEYGFRYRPTVDTGGRSGPCAKVSADSSGAILATVRCTFNGSDPVNVSFVVLIDGIASNQIS